jgi:hypothetical protein
MTEPEPAELVLLKVVLLITTLLFSKTFKNPETQGVLSVNVPPLIWRVKGLSSSKISWGSNLIPAP